MSANEELTALCRRRIESLEIWLRRLINDVLSNVYGPSYFTANSADEQNIINSRIRQSIEKRHSENPGKFDRVIDAALLNNLIDIVCNAKLYDLHFKDALRAAFDDNKILPEGHLLLRNFCERLIEPRNNLSHANPISTRQAEQVLSVTGDLIESIKKYYRENGMEQEYNCPLILSFTDHQGQKRYRDSFGSYTNGGKRFNFKNLPEYSLHPGDTISVSIDVDSAFDGEYKTTFGVNGYSGNDFHQHFSIAVTEKDIGQNYSIKVNVINIEPMKKWARIQAQIEDFLVLEYKVLPLR